MRQILITGLMALGLSFGVGCAVASEAEGDRHEAHNATGGQEHLVKMMFDEETGELLFEPARIEIKSGDTVTWVQVDEFNEHNVVSYPDGIPKGADLFEGPLLNEVGQKYSVTFTKAGTYRYHCHPHEALGMRGVVIVDRESLPGEFREADPSEVHEHGGGGMEMDMEDEHGDDGHDDGGATATHGDHDEAQADHGDAMASMDMPRKNSGHEHPRPSDANMISFWRGYQDALFNDDFDTVAASFAADAIIFEGGVAEENLGSFLEHHLRPEMPMLASISPSLVRQDYMRAGNVGWITTVMKWDSRRDGKTVTTSSTETLNLQFVHDGWKIKHVHWSNRRAE